MKKSFLKTLIVLVFFFGIVSFCVDNKEVFANVLQNQTPEQRVSTIDKTPGLFLNDTARAQWSNFTQEQKVRAMTQTPNLYLLSDEQIKVSSSGSGNPVTDTLNEIKATLASPLAALGKVFTNIISAAGVAILGFFSLILGLVGQFFDMVMAATVTGQGLYNSLKGPISDAWRILRDIANIAIVFSLLYLAIKTILNGNGFAETKTLAGVIVAAILINFSLFFTNLAFTTSNFIAESIGQQIVFSGGGGTESISENIANMIGTKDAIDKLWNQSFLGLAQGKPQGELDTAFNDLRSGILAGLTIFIMAIILFVAAIMLLYRFFVFTVLMITSPFGLISAFIPWFKGTGKRWWGELKKQFIYLPAFMLTLYIALLFIGTLTSSLSPTASTVTYLYYFLLTCGFLLMVLILPSKVAGGGGDMMSNLGSWGVSKIKSLPKRSVQFGGRVAASGVARTGQVLVGNKLANKIGGNTKEKREALQAKAQGTGIGAAIARQQIRTAESLKNKTYDFRNTKAGAGLGLGKGIQSWSATVEAKKKALAERKEKDDKLFGFDQQAKTTQNQSDIKLNEAARDTQAQVVKQKEIAVKQAAAQAAANATVDADGNRVINAADAVALEAAQKEFENEKKELEKREMEVGKLKHKGDMAALALIKKRRERYWNRMSLTQKAAVEKLEKELEEKWKQAGKAEKKKKNKGGNTNSGTTVTVSGAGQRQPTLTGTSGGTSNTTINLGGGSQGLPPPNSGGSRGLPPPTINI